mmetsp:Transcript_44211/g.84520  ORF Transcript_44211/g.84520 Transcript_44211/m.84520 type:complete len:184 (+) Transcript_44211:95-646(+)|eukprot:CAMPEP_0114251792 /NCGR_PEP_ID=MMETSP0058-20121206/15470_1 /TAXON_ID=36894 /ORGANISM="Pyramimonas parkeae, CCMP726" /LENGTH=183 /DNA_ID=CAMNT_0001365639 /DNA_START=90 /DNA_END=641 /DNA_ORIENTATION=-
MASVLQRTTVISPASLSSKRRDSVPLRACAPRVALHASPVTICSAGLSRREASVAGVAAIAAAVLPVGKAQALFGGPSSEEKYAQKTNELIDQILTTIALPRDAENRPDAIKSVKAASNEWVAKYRRDDKFSGRPSYGYVYSAVNAVVGHYNNFGTKAPIPKKRAERIVKECKDAQVAISRGR